MRISWTCGGRPSKGRGDDNGQASSLTSSLPLSLSHTISNEFCSLTAYRVYVFIVLPDFILHTSVHVTIICVQRYYLYLF